MAYSLSPHHLLIGDHSISIFYLDLTDSLQSHEYIDDSFIRSSQLTPFLASYFELTLNVMFKGNYARLSSQKIKSYGVNDNNDFISIVDIIDLLKKNYSNVKEKYELFRTFLNVLDRSSSRIRNFHRPSLILLSIVLAPMGGRLLETGAW